MILRRAFPFALFACLAVHAFSAAPVPPASLDVICGQVANLAPTKLPLKLERGECVMFIGNNLFERMLFTVTEFKVKAGAPVKLILENPDATPHNLVLCQPGAADKIGEAANEMAKLPDAFEKSDFVPKSDQILHATKMLQPNQTDTLRFHAPRTPGSYPYICSFPGHYLVMRGVMIVE